MRALGLTLCFAVALAACSIKEVTFTSVPEDCAAVGDEDGNGLADCDDPACAAACQAVCGNGQLEAAELCDDGNTVTETACLYGTPSCMQCNASCTGMLSLTGSFCGDSTSNTADGEACDDGNDITETACPYGTPGCMRCNASCTAALELTGSFCGDDTPNTADGEACDDGNVITETACPYGTPSCTRCNASCTAELDLTGSFCGDGTPNTADGEACDDGNIVTETACPYGMLSCTRCDASCTAELDLTGSFCGDGTPDTADGEACDDDNIITETECPYGTQSCTRCNASCTMELALTGSFCGDSTPDTDDGEQCDDGNAMNGDGCDNTCTNSISIGLQAYIKATNTNAGDQFGTIAISGDGLTMVVSAIGEDSAVTGINGDQLNNAASSAGAVYVYVRSGPSWLFQAYIKASNTDSNDQFGVSLALSADGSTLAVGARLEASAATGIGGDQLNNTAANAGAVYVFQRTGTTWSQQAYIKASNTAGADLFGASVSLSADGALLAVGAFGEDSSATGIDGNQLDNSATDAGAVYVFQRISATWSQQAYIKASNTAASDQFGSSVTLSGDGKSLAVAATGEDSAATGIGGNQADNTASSAGAVYVFTHNGTTWSQQAYVKASNTGATDQFGNSLAISSDGSTLAVGASLEDSIAKGVDGDQLSNTAASAGAVYVFARIGATWSQQAYVKATNTDAGDQFGVRVALSSNGSTLAVGAHLEDSAAAGVGGDQNDNTLGNSGAVYLLRRSGTVWSHQGYVKASNTGVSDQFGISVALSGDGLTLAAAASGEDSAAIGVDGNQLDNTATDAGAVYVYR